MPKVGISDGGAGIWYQCPGCEGHLHGWHNIPVGRWTWDGDVEKPTITPSVKTFARYGEEAADRVCHHFVRNGKIEYCGDCTHALAGKTVEMQDIEGE